MSLRHETPRTSQSETGSAQTLLAIKRRQTWISIAKTIAVVATFGVAVAMSPRAPSQGAGDDQFNAEADAISGTVTCADGTVNIISAADQTATEQSGGKDQTSSEVSESACGKQIYDISNVVDISDADNSAMADGGFAEVNTGPGSILGTINFDALQSGLECFGTGQITGNCQALSQFAALQIGGNSITGAQQVQSNYPLLEVQLLGSNCTGLELFTGTADLNDATANFVNTSTPSVNSVAVHLTGSSTCVGLPLGTTQYDLSIAGPAVTWSDSADDSSWNYSKNLSMYDWQTVDQIQTEKLVLVYDKAPYGPSFYRNTTYDYSDYNYPSY